MSREPICSQCNGNGREVYEQSCVMCHGEGVIERRDVFYGSISEVCSSCRGNGAIRVVKPCSECHGTGSTVENVAVASV